MRQFPRTAASVVRIQMLQPSQPVGWHRHDRILLDSLFALVREVADPRPKMLVQTSTQESTTFRRIQRVDGIDGSGTGIERPKFHGAFAEQADLRRRTWKSTQQIQRAIVATLRNRQGMAIVWIDGSAAGGIRFSFGKPVSVQADTVGSPII
jgi:hypothetical protein